MCQIVLHTADAEKLTEEYFEGEAAFNSDGFGLAVAVQGRLEVRKGLFEPDEAFSLYEDALLARDPGTAILMHWRFATQGEVAHKNCHPFLVSRSKVALAHNGMLPAPRVVPEDRSDTFYFVQLVFAGRAKSQLFSDRFARRVEGLSGGNKFAYIADDGRHKIINEELGEWMEGSWYSAGAPDPDKPSWFQDAAAWAADHDYREMFGRYKR